MAGKYSNAADKEQLNALQSKHFGALTTEAAQTVRAAPSSGKKAQDSTASYAPPSLTTSFVSSGKGGGAARSIGEKLQVNAANGTLSFGVPVPTSSSRSGLGPQIGLSYDSGQGNGAFGFGWSASMPTISRSTEQGIPIYDDEEDTFLIAGAEDLVPLTNSTGWQETILEGHCVRQYHPRVVSDGARIERWTSLADPAEVHWRTISSQNVVSIYGQTDNSRIVDRSTKSVRIFSWLQCFSHDPHGNAMIFEYKCENDDGLQTNIPIWEHSRSSLIRQRQRYIKSIKYGNVSPARSLDNWNEVTPPKDWLFEVIFDYGEHDDLSPTTKEVHGWPLRKDTFSACTSGFEVRTYRLCRRILMFHHFLDELKRADSLVSSTLLNYDEYQHGTFLHSITISGHSALTEGDKTGYMSNSLPPLRFEYSSAPPPQDLEFMCAQTADIMSLPSMTSTSSEWVDLNGEGLAGVLSRLEDGTMMYQRNRSALDGKMELDFGAVQYLARQPSSGYQEDYYLEDLEGTGRSDLVCLDAQGRLEGYYERIEPDQWAEFTPFTAIPTGSLTDEDIVRIDLTGDGLLDVLHANNANNASWQPSLGKAGFGEHRKVHFPENRTPRTKGDDATAIYHLDMTGDGMTDLVSVSNGQVSYWCNLGQGCFSAENPMSNAPVFDDDVNFTFSRLRFVDIDGSGTADMIYFLPIGGANLYYNLSGNSWSTAVHIYTFPQIDQTTSVLALDLLGNGTGCLCWIQPSQTAGGQAELRYLDLMASKKPHLLAKVLNGTGKVIEATYAPSTHFYLQDEAESKPWTTKLHFPVQCVKETVTVDLLTDVKSVVRYRYHDGYFDGVERDFRGFGMVEQISEEYFPLPHNRSFRDSCFMTRTWFHTGSGEPSSRAFFSDPLIFDRMSNSLPTDDYRQAVRALRGGTIRSEIYDNDGWNTQNLPYVVTESSYQVIVLQPSSSRTKDGIFRVAPSETLTTTYERQKKDLKVVHQMVLAINNYGDIQKSASICYPRNVIDVHPNLLKAQSNTVVELTEVDYTNDVTDTKNFRKPLPSCTRSYRIQCSAGSSIFSLKDFTRLLENTACKIKTGETRVYFGSSDLTKRLPLGALELYSIEAQAFFLAFTPEQLERVLSKVPSSREALTKKAFLDKGGYVDLDSNKFLWQPSSIHGFRLPAESGTELDAARSLFYVHRTTTDPFGHQSYVKMDKYSLLCNSMTNSIGLEASAINDYERLQPMCLIDVNQNQQQAVHDCLGRVVGIASQGKKGDGTGESFQNFTTHLSSGDVEGFFKNPSKELAKKLLGSATERTVYHMREVLGNSNGQSKGSLPSAVAYIARDAPDTFPAYDVRVSITYLDGSSNPYQTFEHCADAESPWRCGGCTLVNNQQLPVRQHLPFFTADHQPVAITAIESPMTLSLHDALQRSTVELYPDGTWSKVRNSTWSSTQYDAGDTVLESNPAANNNGRSLTGQLLKDISWKSWVDSRQPERGPQNVAEKSKIYQDTPVVTHFGPEGNLLLVTETANESTRTLSYDYDLQGNVVAEYDSLRRKTAQYAYDNLGHRVYTATMDGGETWHLSDCLGKPLVHWDCRQVLHRVVYDQLHRETEVWVSTTQATEKLVNISIYGEKSPNAVDSNRLGQLWKQSDQAGTSIFSTRDRRGNCTASTFQVCLDYKMTIDWSKMVELESVIYKHSSQLNYFDEILTNRDANGMWTKVSYNDLGQITGVYTAPSDADEAANSWKPYVVHAKFSADQLPLSIKHGNDTTSTFEYDRLSRAVVNSKITAKNGKVLENISNMYDCMHRKVYTVNDAEQDTFFRNSRIKPESDYTYDAFGQLIAATGREQMRSDNGASYRLEPYNASTGKTRNGLPGDGNQLCAYIETYEHDLAGNLTLLRHHPKSDTKVQGWTRKYIYDIPSLIDSATIGNKLSYTTVSGTEERYKYDGDAGRAGHITSMPGFSSLTWNSEGLLSATSRQLVKEGEPETTYFVYSSEGHRIRKVCERSSSLTGSSKKTDTIYLHEAEILRRYSGNAMLASTRTTSHVNGSSRIAMLEKDDASNEGDLVRYEASDNLELDEKGQIISYEEYSPFGACTYAASGKKIEANRRYRFARYLRDEETGLDLCGERYFIPWLGRWLSADPMGVTGGMNLYCYVFNDPVNFDDSGGTDAYPKRSTPGFKKTFGGREAGYEPPVRLRETIKTTFGGRKVYQEVSEKTAASQEPTPASDSGASPSRKPVDTSSPSTTMSSDPGSKPSAPMSSTPDSKPAVSDSSQPSDPASKPSDVEPAPPEKGFIDTFVDYIRESPNLQKMLKVADTLITWGLKGTPLGAAYGLVKDIVISAVDGSMREFFENMLQAWNEDGWDAAGEFLGDQITKVIQNSIDDSDILSGAQAVIDTMRENLKDVKTYAKRYGLWQSNKNLRRFVRQTNSLLKAVDVNELVKSQVSKLMQAGQKYTSQVITNNCAKDNKKGSF